MTGFRPSRGERKPRFEPFTGGDPVAFVVSTNLHRRHLTESQRAMVAARIANMPNGGDRSEQHRANLHSAAAAADMLNVSERTVKAARAVQRDAVPELTAAVISIADARRARQIAETDNRRELAKLERSQRLARLLGPRPDDDFPRPAA